jgi:hypothetical protein
MDTARPSPGPQVLAFERGRDQARAVEAELCVPGPPPPPASAPLVATRAFCRTLRCDPG